MELVIQITILEAKLCVQRVQFMNGQTLNHPHFAVFQCILSMSSSLMLPPRVISTASEISKEENREERLTEAGLENSGCSPAY